MTKIVNRFTRGNEIHHSFRYFMEITKRITNFVFRMNNERITKNEIRYAFRFDLCEKRIPSFVPFRNAFRLPNGVHFLRNGVH